jgi:hypothetical protein
MRGGIITDFRNKLAAIFGLLVLAICIFSPTVSAKDYSIMELMVEASLIGDFNLSLMDANVSINTEQVTINCTTQFSMNETGAPPKEFSLLLTNVLGAYRSVVNAAPEVGDLLIVMKSWNRTTTLTMTCPKSWIQGIVSGDNNAAYELILKVFQTKKFRNDTDSTYMPATFSWGTPVPNITTTISPSATPVTTILDHSMASNVDESSNHVITRTNEFSSTDNKAYSWLSLGNVGAGTVWWYWYYNNNLYKTSSVDIPPNPNVGYWPSYNIWYYIDIAGDNPADMPGIWYVDVYLGDQKLLREKFALSYN